MSETEKTCPCGSGKPYAECCGAFGKSVLLDQVRWRRAGRELRRKLGEYADQPALCWDAAKAQDVYLGAKEDFLAHQEDEFTMERCFEWFIFDFRSNNGLTIIERFQEEQAAFLDEYEQKLLRDWLKARISLYEVLTAFPDKGIIMQDLLDGKKVTIREINATTEINSGCIVLIRVLKIGEEFEFSTSGLALPERYKPILLAKLAAEQTRFNQKRNLPPQAWAPYLKERSHKINAWVTKFGMAPAPVNDSQPEPPKEQFSIAYRITDWQTALDFFQKSPDFLLTHEARDQEGGLIEAVASQLGKGQGSNGLQAVCARIVLTANALLIIADSPKLLIRARQLSEHLIEQTTGDDAARNIIDLIKSAAGSRSKYF